MVSPGFGAGWSGGHEIEIK